MPFTRVVETRFQTHLDSKRHSIQEGENEEKNILSYAYMDAVTADKRCSYDSPSWVLKYSED